MFSLKAEVADEPGLAEEGDALLDGVPDEVVLPGVLLLAGALLVVGDELGVDVPGPKLLGGGGLEGVMLPTAGLGGAEGGAGPGGAPAAPGVPKGPELTGACATSRPPMLLTMTTITTTSTTAAAPPPRPINSHGGWLAGAGAAAVCCGRLAASGSASGEAAGMLSGSLIISGSMPIKSSGRGMEIVPPHVGQRALLPRIASGAMNA